MEVKTGSYQVQVHIIEVRDLKPEDPNGTSDPVVHIEIGGQTTHRGEAETDELRV